MRPRALIEVSEERPHSNDTYERVRRTLDDALRELELPLEMMSSDNDCSQPHAL
jgi:hypothetical protein